MLSWGFLSLNKGPSGLSRLPQRGCFHRDAHSVPRATCGWGVGLRSPHVGWAVTINPSLQGPLNCFQNIPAEHTPSTKPTQMFLECGSRKWADVMETSVLTHSDCSIWVEFASHFAFTRTLFQGKFPLRSWNPEFYARGTFLKGTGSSFAKKNMPFPWGFDCGWQTGRSWWRDHWLAVKEVHLPGVLSSLSLVLVLAVQIGCGSATQSSLVCSERLSTQKTMGKYLEFLCKLTLLCNIDRQLSNSEISVDEEGNRLLRKQKKDGSSWTGRI